jgi:hypothetical protein
MHRDRPGEEALEEVHLLRHRVKRLEAEVFGTTGPAVALTITASPIEPSKGTP